MSEEPNPSGSPGQAERRFRGGTPKLNEALAKAALNFPESLHPDRQGHHGSYLSLGSILNETRKPLAEHGLVLTQTMRNDVLETRLLHSSGEEIVSEVPIPPPRGPFADVRAAAAAWQAWGTCKSYARRYEAQAVLATAAEKDLDDDDHSGGGQQPGGAKRRKRQQEPQARGRAANPPADPPPNESPPGEPKEVKTARESAEACDTPGKLTAMAKRYKNRTSAEKVAIFNAGKRRGWMWDKKQEMFVDSNADELNPADGKGGTVF